MSTPDSVQHIWTSEELESLTRRELVTTTKVCLLPPFLILSYAPPGLPPYITSPTLVDTFSFTYRV